MRRSFVNPFLYYGGAITQDGDRPAWPFSDQVMADVMARRAQYNASDEADVREGAALWVSACRRVLERAGDRELFVPLSAGLDSRAVLAGLTSLGARPATATYGIPGALDYELTPRIARLAGVEHARFDLSDYVFAEHELLATAASAGQASALVDMHINRQLALRYANDKLVVSGFGGDAVTGKHVPAEPSASWQAACARLAMAARASNTIELAEPGYTPINELPSAAFVEPTQIGFDEQLDFAIRQFCFIRPIVCPAGYDVATPFFDGDWLAFMLSRRFDARRRQRLFIRVVEHAFPALFALPTSARRGLSLSADAPAIARHVRRQARARRWRARLKRIRASTVVPPRNRNWQYIEFAAALRAETSYARVVRRALDWLIEDELVPWLDPVALWDAHREGRANHEKALAVLLSLAVFHRAQPDMFAD